jgi:DNA repair protein RadC
MIKIVYLNTQNQIQEIKDLPQGTVDSSFVYPREVMEGALKCGAVSFVVVHNHPSGNPAPSDADKDLTRKLAQAGSLLQIKLLDHLIIGDNKFYSFAGDGLIEKYDAELLSLKTT